ncbi:hypothetical protein HZB78_00405 [Candidatus Collierbacteria bacterium]|nr:hypothetical protein [Candidatus Collierbacteria bacterium]
MARTRELIHEQIPDFDPEDQRLIDPITGKTLFGDELGDGILVQALIVAPDRRKILGRLTVTPLKHQIDLSPYSRQSRILMAQGGIFRGAEFRPHHPNDTEASIILDLGSLIEEAAGVISETRRTLLSAKKQKTTVPLHGMRPLTATHKIVDSRTAHAIRLQQLHQTPSNFRLSVLTNGTGGFRSPYELQRFQRMREKRG